MLINYLKVAVRSMLRNKILACINIAGLAIGLTAAMLIYMWVQDELSYDRFHEHADDIYRVCANTILCR
jgi:putative ABC transport system permease protein